MVTGKTNAREVWERFWSQRKVQDIYPPVTDIVKELIGVVDSLKNKRVLEIGAGTGRTGIKLAELGADVMLLDYSVQSLRMIKGLTEESMATVGLILANALNSPLNDNSFDIVIHQGLLEHFNKPLTLLDENVRLLKPGGYLLVDVPQTFHIYTFLKHALMLVNKWFGGWERQFTLASLSNLMKKYRLKVVHIYGDWSRPGIFYKILRAGLAKFKIQLPMYPKYLGPLTKKFYNYQTRLRNKRFFLYTVLSIGVIARKEG